MSTVTKEIADKVIAGEYPEDGWTRVVKYTNKWGGESYGLENNRSIGRYSASDYVINPEVYWSQS